MANPSTLAGDVYVLGTLSAQSLRAPSGSIANAAIASGSPGSCVAASKLQHQFPVRLDQAAGTAATSETRLVHICQGAGLPVAVRAVAAVAPTGGDKQVSIDVKRSTGGAAFATILTAPIVLDSSCVDRTPVLGLLDSVTLAAGDVIEIAMTVSGATGSQAQGVCIELFIAEDPA